MRTILSLIALLSLTGQSAPPPNTPEPGDGVLCLGTFIYFAEKHGKMCRPGEDPEFQARIASYSQRFDAYIIRNSDGGAETLGKFKDGQNLNSTDTKYICEGDIAYLYDRWKESDQSELAEAVEMLLERDGPPRWGDCV